ncbi:hypothetical protein [Paracidovorax citrulli]
MVTFAGTVIAKPAILKGIRVPVAAAARELRWFKIEIRAHAESWARLVFYGSWLADLGIRSPGLIGPAFGSGLQVATTLLPIIQAVGSVLSGLEGWVALFDLHRARIALRDAKATKSRLEDAHQRALKGLDERNKDRAARKIREAEAQRLRERAIELALAPHTDCTLPNHPVCDLLLRSQVAGIEAQIAELAAQDKPFPAQEDCDAYLAYVDADATGRKTDGYTSAKLTCARDLGVQSIKTAFDAFGDPLLSLTKGALESISAVLGVAMGVGHAAQGVFDYQSAEREKRSLIATSELVSQKKADISTDAKRKDRLSDKAAAGVQAIFEERLESRKEDAATASRWARMRIGYGAFSITNGLVAAGVTLALLGGVASGAAPMILAVGAAAATTAGILWLTFALYKLACRWRTGLVEHRERIATGKIVSVRSPSHWPRLGQYTLDQLRGFREESLRSDGKINAYLEAAILARQLQEGGEGSTKKRNERLATSTMLQVYGMSKTTTSLLKRASFDTAHDAIYKHLTAKGVLRSEMPKEVGST